MAASERTLDPENQKYHVLMIVTDGVINDMGNTMDALVAAADLPFSVIMCVRYFSFTFSRVALLPWEELAPAKRAVSVRPTAFVQSA